MLSSNACRFFLISCLSLVANADTVRGAQRELSGEPKVELLTAENYVILASSGISTAGTSDITGDIAVSPIAAFAMSGFSLALDPSGKFSTSEQVSGRAYAANYVPTSPANLTLAVGAMGAAYTNAAGRVNTNATRINIGSGVLGGDGVDGLNGGENAPLTPGVYTFGSDVTINRDITFEGTNPGENDDPDIFIIQMTGNLKQVGDTKVILTGGAIATNIFWQIAGYVKVLAGPDTHMKGILLVKTAVLFETGSSLSGRVLAQTAVTLQKATITEDAVE
jgi:hypothetical protein